MYSNTAARSSVREAHLWRYTSSVLMVAKKLSATALSQQLPLRLMLTVTPRLASAERYSSLVYWQPRSEWCSRPAEGLRRRIAMSSAARGSLVESVVSRAQPTTEREYRSRMAAR